MRATKLVVVVQFAADEALAAARAVEASMWRVPLQPVHGAPFTVKDWIDTSELPRSGGDPQFFARMRYVG